jgi:hypothetical protein
MNKKDAQSILDFILAFLAVAVFSVGIVRTWIWFNANYARRQVAYQKGRLYAGKPKEPYSQPRDIGANKDCPDCKYEPLDLTEKWVFEGKPSGTLTGSSGEEPPEYDAKDICIGRCLGARDPDNPDDFCGDTIEEFNYNCSCYVNCICNEETKLTRTMYTEQAARLKEQAKKLRDGAKSMREAAEQCDDPWEFCYWLTGGPWRNTKTKAQLLHAAERTDRIANRLDKKAIKLEQWARDIHDCCMGMGTLVAQETCIDDTEQEACCNGQCSEISEKWWDACLDVCDANVNKQSTQAAHDNCDSACAEVKQGCYDDCDDTKDGCYKACEAAGGDVAKCKAKCDSAHDTCDDDCDGDYSYCKKGCDSAWKLSTKNWKGCYNSCDGYESNIYQRCYNPCFAGEGHGHCTRSHEED